MASDEWLFRNRTLTAGVGRVVVDASIASVYTADDSRLGPEALQEALVEVALHPVISARSEE